MRPSTGDRALVMATWVFVVGNAVLLTIGSLALAYGPTWYRTTVLAASGALPIKLSGAEELVWLVLLLGCPVILIVSLHLGARLARGSGRVQSPERGSTPICYAVLALLFSIDPLWRANTRLLGTLVSFGDFDQWKQQRWELFEFLTFPEFVIVYSLIPILAIATVIAAVVRVRGGARFPWLTVCLVMGLVLTVDVLLAMKKQLVLHLAMLSVAMWQISAVSWRFLATSMVPVVVSFVVLVYLSGSAAAPLSEGAEGGAATPITDSAPSSWQTLVDSLPEPGSSLQFWIHSLTSRSALPSIYYVYAFPDEVPHTGINVPYIGTSTGQFHNIAINDVMYPGQQGTSYSGWAFAFYAEAGLWWAVIGTAVLGLGIGVTWSLCGCTLTAERRQLAWLLLVSFLLLLNTDDWVNNAVSSYGIVYPLMLLVVLELLCGRRPDVVRVPPSAA